MQWGPALCRALCVPFSTSDPTMKHLQSITLLLTFLSTPAYAEQVQATWYGNELRGHRTASGEIFNPSGMTAAHRSCLWHLSSHWQSPDGKKGCGASE